MTPSVELLQTVLSLAGAMPESVVARLRPLVARIVEELTRQLAARLRPALAGITTPRPTRRPGGPLDLPRTLRANLATTRRDGEGRVQVIPERPVFRTKARRGVDWRLVLVVDVSGSMEASVIWSALTGAILAGVPALTTHFVAFSTEVVDLTDRVSDPLGLLLEVKVGGGTHIAAGLRHARSLVTVPSRTLVVVVVTSRRVPAGRAPHRDPFPGRVGCDRPGLREPRRRGPAAVLGVGGLAARRVRHAGRRVESAGAGPLGRGEGARMSGPQRWSGSGRRLVEAMA